MVENMDDYYDGKASLAEQIQAAEGKPLGLALHTSDHMSIRDVRQVLEQSIAPVNPELCHRFINEWLERMNPTHRLAAWMEILHLYLVDLVTVPHAEDLIVERTLTFGAQVFEDLNRDFCSNSDLADHPDSSLDIQFVEGLENEVRDPIASVVVSLRSYVEQLKALQQQADGEDA